MTVLTDEKRAEILALREQGLGYTRIAKRAGVSTGTVRRVAKPGYAEHHRRLSRDAKRRRTGICKVCGGETKYSGNVGGPVISDMCKACARKQQHDNRYWKREQIIEAIQEYARRHGQQPVSTDWHVQSRPELTEPDGFMYPYVTVVLREFGSWANAIEEAGFERPRVGWNPRGRKKGRSRVPEETVRQRIVDFYEKNGVTPSSINMRSEYETLRRRGVSWKETLLSLGITPNYQGRPRRVR